MKNKILNKTAGIIIIAGMLCAMLTAGCTKADSNTDNGSASTEPASTATAISTEPTTTEATSPATTEATSTATAISTEPTTTEATSPATTTAVTDKDYPLTLTVPQEYINNNLGITVECTDSKYKNLYVETLKDRTESFEITDDCIKEIFDISVCKRYGDRFTKVDETVRVSIPYEEGMYVVHSVKNMLYDINAEYIDGKYVFETDRVGEFIMRTKPVGRTSPTKTTEFIYEEQTLVDEVTGIKVSGNIPIGSEIDTTIYIIDCASFSDSWESDIIEYIYPEYTNVIEYYTEYEYEKKVENIGKILKEKNWSSYEGSPGAKIFIEITIVKDYEIIDFNSDMTVTLPFDYHAGLVRGGIKDGPKVVQYDYSNKKFVNLDIVSADATPKGEFQFKINDVGCFFLGGASNVDQIVERYDRI